jgi:hypothetical protein
VNLGIMARIPADRTAIISSPSNFLVHVKVLARLFRGKLLAMLTQAHVEGRLTFFTTMPSSPTRGPSRGSWRRCAASSGWSTARTPSRSLSIKDLHLRSFASLPGALCSSTPSFRCPVPLPSAWARTRRRWPKCGRLPSWDARVVPGPNSCNAITSLLGLPRLGSLLSRC